MTTERTGPSASETASKGDEGAGSVDHAETEEPAGRPCPLCGASMHHRHCKYVCPEHGVVYDCADTFY